MKVNGFKKKNTQRYIMIIISLIIALTCYMGIVKPEYLKYTNEFKIVKATGAYILLISVGIILNTMLDGVVFFKYKFNIMIGALWLIVLYYIYCRFYNYGLSWESYTIWYYISLISAIAVIIMPFTIKACDNTGVISIKKHDFIWIVLLILQAVRGIILINTMRINNPLFDDIVYKLIYGIK